MMKSISFERGRDPKESMRLGKRAQYDSLKEGDILRLISDKGFDDLGFPDIGDLLLIHNVVDDYDIGKDGKKISYYIIDDQGRSIGNSDQWGIYYEFFSEYFELVEK